MALLQHPEHSNVMTSYHPVILDALSHIRRANSPKSVKKKNTSRIGVFLGYEILKRLETVEKNIRTPVTHMRAPFLSPKKVIFVYVLGAGYGFSNDLTDMLVPNAPEAFLALSRDENTFEITNHYSRLPKDLSEYLVVVCEPMCATGNSTELAVTFLKGKYCAKDIVVMSLLITPDGAEQMEVKHPDVSIYAAGMDPDLTPENFIYPGAGDVGDEVTGVIPG